MKQVVRRKAERGMYIVQMAGVFLIFLMVAALGIDSGIYFSAQNQLQTAADSGALSGAMELATSEGLSALDRQDDVEWAGKALADDNMLEYATITTDDVEMGYVNPQTGTYDEIGFSTPGSEGYLDYTGGYNAVRVLAKRTGDTEKGGIKTLMARLLHQDAMDAAAMSIAFMNQNVISVTNGGVRPIYACEGQFDKAGEDGVLSNNVIKIYNDRLEVDGTVIGGCPTPGSGNWGFADLRDCDPGSPGASNTVEWFKNGFPGTIKTERCKSTQPGNFLSNNGMGEALDQLIAEETVILIPIYDGYAGGGSNTQVDIAGFTGFVITGYNNKGKEENRNITGYFTRAVCNGACQTGPSSDGANGAVIGVRLAGRS